MAIDSFRFPKPITSVADDPVRIGIAMTENMRALETWINSKLTPTAALYTDHDEFAGLGDDDHTQYLNVARHDLDDHAGVDMSAYLPLTAGDTKPITGQLYMEHTTGKINFNGVTTVGAEGVGLQAMDADDALRWVFRIENNETPPKVFVSNRAPSGEVWIAANTDGGGGGAYEKMVARFGHDIIEMWSDDTQVAKLDLDGFKVPYTSGALPLTRYQNTGSHAFTAVATWETVGSASWGVGTTDLISVTATSHAQMRQNASVTHRQVRLRIRISTDGGTTWTNGPQSRVDNMNVTTMTRLTMNSVAGVNNTTPTGNLVIELQLYSAHTEVICDASYFTAVVTGHI